MVSSLVSFGNNKRLNRATAIVPLWAIYTSVIILCFFTTFSRTGRTISLLIFLGATTLTAIGQSPLVLTASEQFVMDNLRATGTADLSTLRDGTLRHEFVERLITGTYKNSVIATRGINISHAIVKEALRVTNINISFPLRLKFCQLEDRARLRIR